MATLPQRKEEAVIRKKIIRLFMFVFSCVLVVGCSKGGEIQNKDKSFRIVSSWEKTGIGSHMYAGTDIGPLKYFTVEGLYQYVRSTDQIFPMLAEDLPKHSNDGLTSTIKIKANAKWQNGEDFISKDVWAFYYLNHTLATNYMLSIDTPDNKTLIINWNPNRMIVDDVKNLLLAQDISGTVSYSEFKTYADAAHQIVTDSDDIDANSGRWGAFNKFSKGALLAQLTANINAYKNHKTSWFVATGAFKLNAESATQLLLVKNNLHWNANNIGFERIEAYNVLETTQIYMLLSDNRIDYFDTYAPIDTQKSILDNNHEMAHLKMYDPGAIGVLFNIEKPIWQDKVREAFQYLFDRNEIKNIGNPYAVTSWYPLLGMAPTEAEKWMSSDGFEDIPTYSHNITKATQLLEESGWSKNNNAWHYNNQKVNLTLGVDRNHPGQSQVAVAVQAALQNFGITVTLKMSDFGTWYTAATSNNSLYDFSIHWTDLNMSFSYPTGTYTHFNSIMSNIIHVNRFPMDYPDEQLRGRINEEFDGLGSKFSDSNGKVNFADYTDTMYTYDGKDLNTLIDIYNLGFANKNWGIQFYQNVTGSFINIERIKNVPLESILREDRNTSYVPRVGTEDFYNVAMTNLNYCNGIAIVLGIYQPK